MNTEAMSEELGSWEIQAEAHREELKRVLENVEYWREANEQKKKEITHLRQRVAELERIIEQDADQLMMRDKIIRERGERMKAMRKAYDRHTGMRGSWSEFFDKKTGEPL